MQLPDWSGRPSAHLAGHFNRILRAQFPQALWHGNRRLPQLALTFDDGPHPQDTPALLALLARYDVRATFFMLGARAAQYPYLVRAVAAAGHQIGIHGYHHRAFPLEQTTALRAMLADAQQVIADAAALPPTAVNCVRPPYGLATSTTLRALTEWGYQPVMWSVIPFHWMQSAPVSIHQVLEHTENGALIVLHEGLPGPPIIKIAYSVVDALVTAGYAFVTVDEMRARRDTTR